MGFWVLVLALVLVLLLFCYVGFVRSLHYPGHLCCRFVSPWMLLDCGMVIYLYIIVIVFKVQCFKYRVQQGSRPLAPGAVYLFTHYTLEIYIIMKVSVLLGCSPNVAWNC